MHAAPRPRAGLSFNGEYLERHAVQILGSYRAYNPALMRFHNPDSLSPFGKGGLNGYGYCLGDPLNHADPTGHLALWAWAKSNPFNITILSLSAAAVPIVVSSIVPNEIAKKALYGASAVLFTTAIASAAFALVRGRYIRVQQRRDAGRQHEAWRTRYGLQTRQPSVADGPPPSYAEVTKEPPDIDLPSYDDALRKLTLRRNSYERAMQRNHSSVRDSIRETRV
ncbi:MAG: RHS repeat-associated core domain-containing protein [Paucimonas sp.]|jgi:RHS repeat-associated protein|nr:RHS repeat-associated core domain-containing protein [Paucimonas sp.]